MYVTVTCTCIVLYSLYVQVVAIGNDWVAIATDKLFIRIYTLGGVQREIISCPGQVITMSGCGSQLGVVYQETEGM